MLNGRGIETKRRNGNQFVTRRIRFVRECSRQSDDMPELTECPSASDRFRRQRYRQAPRQVIWLPMFEAILVHCLFGSHFLAVRFFQAHRRRLFTPKPQTGADRGRRAWPPLRRLAHNVLSKRQPLAAAHACWRSAAYPDVRTRHVICKRGTMTKYKLEYIWLDGYTPVPNFVARPRSRSSTSSRSSSSCRCGASTAARPCRPRAAARIAC